MRLGQSVTHTLHTQVKIDLCFSDSGKDLLGCDFLIL